MNRMYTLPGTIEPLRVSVNNACSMLGISRTTIYRHAREGLLKITRDGGRSFISMTELKRFVQSQERLTKAKGTKESK
jgi:excisionase family DNA binding protein